MKVKTRSLIFYITFGSTKFDLEEYDSCVYIKWCLIMYLDCTRNIIHDHEYFNGDKSISETLNLLLARWPNCTLVWRYSNQLNVHIRTFRSKVPMYISSQLVHTNNSMKTCNTEITVWMRDIYLICFYCIIIIFQRIRKMHLVQMFS